jgi:hypothetical protein
MPVFVPIVMQLGRVVLQAGTRSVFNFLKKQGFKQIAKNSKKAKNAPKVTKLNQVKKLQKPTTQTKPKAQTQTKPTSQTKPKSQTKTKTQQSKKPKDQKKPGNIITRNPGKTITALTTIGALGLGQLTGPEKIDKMPKKKDVKVSDNKKTSETKTSEKKQNTQPLKKLKDIKVKDIKTKKISPPKEDKSKPSDYTGRFIDKKGDVAYESASDFFRHMFGTPKKRAMPTKTKRLIGEGQELERKQADTKGAGKGIKFRVKKSKGGTISKSRKGHTDMRKGGLFYG